MSIHLSDEEKAERDDVKLYKIDGTIIVDYKLIKRYWPDSLIKDFPERGTLSGGGTKIFNQCERVI